MLTKASMLAKEKKTKLMSAWAIASNVFFFVPAARAATLGVYTEAFILATIGVISGGYHHMQYLAGFYDDPDTYRILQRTDDFAALLSFVVVGVYLLALGRSPAKGFLYFVGAVLVYFTAEKDDFTAIIGIGILLGVSFIIRLITGFHTYPWKDLDLIDLFVAALFAGAGVLIYFLDNDDINLHGLWHVLLSFACYFALESLHHEWTLLFWRRKPQ